MLVTCLIGGPGRTFIEVVGTSCRFRVQQNKPVTGFVPSPWARRAKDLNRERPVGRRTDRGSAIRRSPAPTDHAGRRRRPCRTRMAAGGRACGRRGRPYAAKHRNSRRWSPPLTMRRSLGKEPAAFRRRPAEPFPCPFDNGCPSVNRCFRRFDLYGQGRIGPKKKAPCTPAVGRSAPASTDRNGLFPTADHRCGGRTPMSRSRSRRRRRPAV